MPICAASVWTSSCGVARIRPAICALHRATALVKMVWKTGPSSSRDWPRTCMTSDTAANCAATPSTSASPCRGFDARCSVAVAFDLLKALVFQSTKTANPLETTQTPAVFNVLRASTHRFAWKAARSVQAAGDICHGRQPAISARNASQTEDGRERRGWRPGRAVSRGRVSLALRRAGEHSVAYVYEIEHKTMHYSPNSQVLRQHWRSIRAFPR